MLWIGYTYDKNFSLNLIKYNNGLWSLCFNDMILSIIINYFLLIDDAEKEIEKLDTLLELSSKGLEGPFWNYDYETAEDFAMGILKDQDVFKVELLDALDNKVVSFQKSRFLPKDLIIRETKIYKGPQIIGLCRIGIDGQYRKNKVPVILTRILY